MTNIKSNTGLSMVSNSGRVNTFGVISISSKYISFDLLDYENNVVASAKDEILITENELNAVQAADNIFMSALKVVVNVINDNKDKELDSVGIISVENSLMVWNSYSSDAIFDNIMHHDKRAHILFPEFMGYLAEQEKTDPVEWLHTKTGKWLSANNGLCKILWLCLNVTEIRDKLTCPEQREFIKFGSMDSFIINKLTGNQCISSLKAHEFGFVNLRLEYDHVIMDHMNNFLNVKLKTKGITYLDWNNFPEIKEAIADYGQIDFKRESKNPDYLYYTKRKAELIEKKKTEKEQSKSKFKLTEEEEMPRDDYELKSMDEMTFTVHDDKFQKESYVSNYMFSEMKAIHFTEQIYEIVFNQKLSDYSVHIMFNSPTLTAALGGCSMLRRGSCYADLSDECEIIYSTGTECILYDVGLETVPLANVQYESDIIWGLKGKLSSCGNIIKFLKSNLNLIKIESKIDEILVDERIYNFEYYQSPVNLHFVPALFGLKYPYERPDARCTLVGLNTTHTSNDIIKAAVEGIAHTVYDIYKSLCKTTENSDLYVGGSYSYIRTLLEYLCNLLQKDLLKHKSLPTLFGEDEKDYFADVSVIGAKFCIEVSYRNCNLQEYSKTMSELNSKKLYHNKYFYDLQFNQDFLNLPKLNSWRNINQYCNSMDNFDKEMKGFKCKGMYNVKDGIN